MSETDWLTPHTYAFTSIPDPAIPFGSQLGWSGLNHLTDPNPHNFAKTSLVTEVPPKRTQTLSLVFTGYPLAGSNLPLDDTHLHGLQVRVWASVQTGSVNVIVPSLQLTTNGTTPKDRWDNKGTGAKKLTTNIEEDGALIFPNQKDDDWSIECKAFTGAYMRQLQMNHDFGVILRFANCKNGDALIQVNTVQIKFYW